MGGDRLRRQAHLCGAHVVSLRSSMHAFLASRPASMASILTPGDGLSGSVILEAREALAKNQAAGKNAVESLIGLVRNHDGTHTAGFGTVRPLQDGSISRIVEPPARSLYDRGRTPGGRTATPRETRTPGNTDSGQARGSNGHPVEDTRRSTPGALKASHSRVEALSVRFQ